MILSVNDDSLLGCSYDSAASLLKKAEGMVTLKICSPGKTDEKTQPQKLEPDKLSATRESKSSIQPTTPVAAAAAAATPKKPAPSPAKEIVNLATCEIKTNQETEIDVATDGKALGIRIVGGSDSMVSVSNFLFIYAGSYPGADWLTF